MIRTSLAVMIATLALTPCDGKPSDNKPPQGSASAAPMVAGTPANVAVTSKGAPRCAEGYWQMSSFTAEGSPMMKQYYCVGADSEKKYSLFDQLTIMGNCSRSDFKRTSAGWDFIIQCAIMDQKLAQTGTIAGDFQNSFAMTTNVVENGGSPRKGTIEGKRVGECPAGFKPGDLVNSAGKKMMNLL
ncbi:hypothetical protein C1T17_13815 [Sphingobium sp. SCG-1]|uniref:DUF3617 domain-containing protein n=1 Tax=Sphingobium sp. SCG-1 TaxID=2072936 RepID=UPI000CD6BE89|nr:DUF3617 family protein [Sphingobium sp. SCG-1]AUW59010.1 hypothetical protein C1T17_13815 [Sphingobium sp. SCG-1]